MNARVMRARVDIVIMDAEPFESLKNVVMSWAPYF
jgi:hypothetical protein